MSISFSTLIRMASFLVVAANILAIGVGRLVPPIAPSRHSDISGVGTINGYHFASDPRSPRTIDPRTGRLETLRLPDTDRLDHASVSPWRDEHGQGQVAGRWTRRSGSGAAVVTDRIGIARFSYPDGQALEVIDTGVVPVGPPCWYPAQSSAILFAGGDGRLYRHEFGRVGGAEEPEPLVWSCELPSEGRMIMSDPAWPDDARLGGRLLVSLSTLEPGDRIFCRPKLWWLKLDASGTAIVAAGRFTSPAPGDLALASERCPTVFEPPGAGPTLAYLTRGDSDSNWSLRVAPIEFDPVVGDPTARADLTRLVAGDCVTANPSANGDGSLLSFVVHPDHSSAHVARFQIEGPGLPPAIAEALRPLVGLHSRPESPACPRCR